MAKERALDIFTLLEQLDRKNYQVWDQLTEEQKKEFSPVVVLRWMAGTTDPLQLIFLNEIMNLMVFNLSDQKELLMKLFAVCSNGRQKRYKWINYKIGGSKKVSKSVELIAQHFRLSFDEAEDTRKLLSQDEILEIAELQGCQKDEIAEIKKEFK